MSHAILEVRNVCFDIFVGVHFRILVRICMNTLFVPVIALKLLYMKQLNF